MVRKYAFGLDLICGYGLLGNIDLLILYVDVAPDNYFGIYTNFKLELQK